MIKPFREITDSVEWSRLIASQSPFFQKDWEDELLRAFPYIRFRHFIYRDTHAVRLAQIDDRMTSVPFSDGGDVVALSDLPLSLEAFRTDLIEQFGKAVMVRVHAGFAPVVSTDAVADLIDYRIDLTTFELGGVRKTLRHILEAGMADGCHIRRAVPADTNRIYRLYLGTMREAAGIALPRTTFDHLMHHDVFVFVREGCIEAASVFLTDDVAAHYFIGTSSQAGKREHAPHHVLFHAIKHYQGSSRSSLFLGGVNADSSLRVFKEGWRGEMCPVYTISGASAHESARRSPLRTLWKLIPARLLPFATRMVGRRVF